MTAAPRPAPRLLTTVHDTRWLSPSMRRIRLTGPDLTRFIWPGPASHLKLVLPLDDTPWPTETDPNDGNGDYLAPERVITRTYTPRHWDAVNQLLTLDIFVHGDGPASSWSTTAQPGDRAAVSLPKAYFTSDPGGAWLIVAGDESAAPAIATILDADPGHRPVQVFVETSTSRDCAGLDGRAHIVQRDSDAPGQALNRTLKSALPNGAGQIWLAGEAASIRTMRRWLLGEQKLATASVITRGYWRSGEHNHPDHDFGE